MAYIVVVQLFTRADRMKVLESEASQIYCCGFSLTNLTISTPILEPYDKYGSDKLRKRLILSLPFSSRIPISDRSVLWHKWGELSYPTPAGSSWLAAWRRHCCVQDPGSFDSETQKMMRDAMMVRYSLLPYLYTLFYHAHVHGNTVVRALFHEYVLRRFSITFLPLSGGVQSIAMSGSVCLSVCSHIWITTRPNFTKFSQHVAFGHSSVFLWRRCDTLCTVRILLFFWMTSSFYVSHYVFLTGKKIAQQPQLLD